MLTLKLLLVPLFLLVLSVVSQRLGPQRAGWLAGLPVIAGPLLLLLALDKGKQFTAAAAAASATLASVSFALTFAHICRRFTLPVTLPLALLAWLAVACMLAYWPRPSFGLGIGAVTAAIAPHLFPNVEVNSTSWRLSRFDLILRMVAGAALTLVVTLAADRFGAAWAGVLAVFPILSLVLAVFSYRTAGAAFTIALLRAMAFGLYSFVAFCATLVFALLHLETAVAFTLALLASVTVQRATQLWLTPR